MSEFTEKQPEDKTFQLKGTFCFYSPRRGSEYNTRAFKLGQGPVVVNYYGTMLSDGTPGGLAGETFVRPDDPGSYVLVGKVVSRGSDPRTILEEVNLAKEVALQSGLPYEEPRAQEEPAPEAEEKAPERKAKVPRTGEQLAQEKNSRRAFNAKAGARLRHYMNKYKNQIRKEPPRR